MFCRNLLTGRCFDESESRRLHFLTALSKRLTVARFSTVPEMYRGMDVWTCFRSIDGNPGIPVFPTSRRTRVGRRAAKSACPIGSETRCGEYIRKTLNLSPWEPPRTESRWTPLGSGVSSRRYSDRRKSCHKILRGSHRPATLQVNHLLAEERLLQRRRHSSVKAAGRRCPPSAPLPDLPSRRGRRTRVEGHRHAGREEERGAVDVLLRHRPAHDAEDCEVGRQRESGAAAQVDPQSRQA